MYAVSISAEGDCYVRVPPDPGIEAAALGASESAAPGARESAALGAGESALSGIESAQVFHTFTLNSGASCSFFRDRTTLTPLSRPVAVSLADPSGGPVLARYSSVLSCPAAPSGSLSGLYLPSFSTNLVAASSQVFAAASRSGPESAPCSCRLLSHQTLLWHHRLGHPSLPRLRGMASRVLVSGLPRSLPPLPPGPAPTCVPCVEGWQCAAPHSSKFPPTEAPLQTLHMDVWGPARVRGQGHERYFLLVVDDYSRYTTVFPLRSKGERQGVDYFQTFSPTPKMTTLRVLLHVAAQRDYELHSLDFSTAFLQGSLHEEIWLRRPPGFTGSFPPGIQWSLRRPVYGLRQAPREWHDTLRTTLAALGFSPSTADPSLFLRTETLLPLFYILVYVDDLVFATADTAGLAHVKSEVQKRHTCTDVGELRSYLGLQITRDRARRTITLTQSHMVQQVL
ncbi:unnamed protein product [Closterium sp. NIES-53]